jgi:hypothetical protein
VIHTHILSPQDVETTAKVVTVVGSEARGCGVWGMQESGDGLAELKVFDLEIEH